MSHEREQAVSSSKEEQDLVGVVKWYSIAKGYGFLDYEGQDVFMHHSLVNDDDRPREGERVRFSMIEGPKGLQATRIDRESDADAT